jgi:hypothetical protein
MPSVERGPVGWRDVWAALRQSAERRLGRPLLLLYLAMAVVGIATVAASLIAMRL